MVADRDVQDLLSTGIWTTKRAKSPRPFNPIRPTTRANQSYKLARLSSNDPKIPRIFACISHIHMPPPPTVEDEEDSIAKESNGFIVHLNDEEPKCKGDKDQFPIILPVPEHNPERRFVIVAPPETDEEDFSDGSKTSSTKTKRTANSKLPLHSVTKARHDEPPPIQRRRSRAELPRIDTDSEHHTHHKAPSFHRSMSATCVEQSQRNAGPRDYFSSHPESARPTGEQFLTPCVKHATKGRERAYWSLSSGANGAGHKDSSLSGKAVSADRRGMEGYARSSIPNSLAANKRLQSEMEVPKLKKTVERHHAHRDDAHSRSRHAPLSPALDRKQSPPRLSRRDTCPARSRGEALRTTRDRSSYHGRASPPKSAIVDSSDEGREHKRHHRHHRERRRSTVIHDARSSLGVSERPSHIPKSKSKPPSPLPSPKLTHERFFEVKSQSSARGSTIISVERPSSPVSSGSSSSTRSRSKCRPRASSRAPSVMSNTSSGKPLNAALSLSAASLPSLATSSKDRKPHTLPPTPTFSRQNSMDTTPRWHSESLQPPAAGAPLTPRHSETDLEHSVPSIISYRRYSEDVSAGILPDLPDCPRRRPRVGLTDWFTLPRNDKLNICPSCYEQVFRPTAFRDFLSPAPARSRDKPLACDLGSSPWYRIAWLMTRKHRRADLRLLQGIAEVSAKNKVPCYGPVRVTRTWHSILDPETRRCISSFKVCTPCAESVQILFPSLTGVFVPLDRTAEPKPGQCSLHFAPHRSRFVTYFDILEDTHDRAMARNTVPDIQRLAERIDGWTDIVECPLDEPLRRTPWYTMGHIPDMTVCEDCFLNIVYPVLVVDAEAVADGALSEGRTVNAVARDFDLKPHIIKSATLCQLASPEMKHLFRRAFKKHDGLAYLDTKVRNRLRLL